MNKKSIAKYALNFIGGKPKVFEYHNGDKSKSIDIMTSVNSRYSDSIVVSTIGLCDTEISLNIDDKPLRVELISIADSDFENLENIVAEAAFYIMDEKSAYPGFIIENVYKNYIEDATTKHAVLLTPPYWDDYKSLDCGDCVVAWLYLLPVTDNEVEYIIKNGIIEFENLIDQKGIDTLDFGRDSAV